MRTLRELAELVDERERDLAYGSETTLLGDFVYEYDVTQRCIEQRGEEPVDEETYQAWKMAYDRMEEYDAQGVEYSTDDLW